MRNTVMEQAKIDRINALARKAKTPEGLTDGEKAERAALRREYVSAVTDSLRAQLDNTYLADGQGNRRRLARRDEGEQK